MLVCGEKGFADICLLLFYRCGQFLGTKQPIGSIREVSTQIYARFKSGKRKTFGTLRFIWGASIEHIILGGFIQDMIFRIDDVSSVLSSQYDSESSCVFFMSRWFKRPLLFIFPGCYERNLREGSLKYRFWGDQRMHMYGKFVHFSLIVHISLGLQWTD